MVLRALVGAILFIQLGLNCFGVDNIRVVLNEYACIDGPPVIKTCQDYFPQGNVNCPAGCDSFGLLCVDGNGNWQLTDNEIVSIAALNVYPEGNRFVPQPIGLIVCAKQYFCYCSLDDDGNRICATSSVGVDIGLGITIPHGQCPAGGGGGGGGGNGDPIVENP